MNKPQERASKKIIVWRESVAAGDDASAPHEIKLDVENDESIETTIGKIIAARYLPTIQGGKATWILVGKQPLAVIAQQRSEPYYLVESTSHTKDFVELTNNCQLECKYWCQVEPGEVVASIKEGKPLPDKYGRDRSKQDRPGDLA